MHMFPYVVVQHSKTYVKLWFCEGPVQRNLVERFSHPQRQSGGELVCPSTFLHSCSPIKKHLSVLPQMEYLLRMKRNSVGESRTDQVPAFVVEVTEITLNFSGKQAK